MSYLLLYKVMEHHGRYGVAGIDNSVVYECDFPLETARRIVQLSNNRDRELEWSELSRILEAEGFDLSLPDINGGAK